MNKRVVPLWQGVSFNILVFVLAITGFAQMPIFKRYYIADIPGLGWLAQYYATHLIHYAAACVFLALIGYFMGRWIKQWRVTHRISAGGWVRAFLIAGIIGTGAMRVAK
ncbi:MAG: FeS-binding protein, partial [Desulfonatronovibrionaceae bacterium]